jgi:hypothetical protein
MKNGTVLFTTTNVPMVVHVGVCIVLNGSVYVLHNTPTKKNNFGGNVIIDPLQEFLQNRYILNRIETFLTADYIVHKCANVYRRKWDAKLFNCEDFINYVTDLNIDPTQSTQALAGVSILALCSFLYF